MCGIAGIIDFNAIPSESLLRRMLGLIRHRGPDAFGLYADSQAGLAHARLSILDLAGGDQPIHNEDQSLWLVYNGEIFNYPELREGLIRDGHRFYTRTDTEILVHLYEEKGTDLFKDLNGQFAFALWDKTRQRLILGRDRLGVRPLFYQAGNGRLVFGSEIKALFADPGVPRRIDLQTLADIFTAWVPLGEETPFEGIRQIPPGRFATFSSGGLKVTPYWRPSFSEKEEDEKPADHYLEPLKALLEDAVRIRLRADVPVGAYLSGGLDSTYITSLVKRRFDNRLRTFSVGFRDERFDESLYQDQAAAALNTDHRAVQCTDRDIGQSFPRVVWHAESPLVRTAPAPLYRLSRLVRDNGFKVVLTGEGADEIFAGYDIFKEDRIRRFWARQPQSKWRPRLFSRLYPDIFPENDGKALAFRMGFFRRGLDQTEDPAYSHRVRWDNTAQIQNFFTKEVSGFLDGQASFRERFLSRLPADFMSWDPLSRAQYIELTTFLPNYLLSSQGDRMAMAHAVEGRYPFLDYRVVEFAARIPPRFRLSGLKEKVILRQAAAEVIPSELARRPKRPYRAPISRCFLGPGSEAYVRGLLSEQQVKRAGYFDPLKVSKLVQKGDRQQGFLASERENMALVGIISTQLVHEQFIENFPGQIEEPGNIKVYRS